ncbi:hypothetical protein ACOMHN_019821 [Nucella lapillus]
MASSSANDADPTTSTMDCDTSNAEEPKELFPGCTSITEFSQKMLKTVVGATKASNDLPTGDDYEYYSTYDNVRTVMHLEARRILQLMQNMMRHHNVKGTISGTDHALELDEQFDVIMDANDQILERVFDVMMDANDQILERVATAVDEATGVKKDEQKLVLAAITRPNPAVASWNKKRTSTGGSTPMQLMTTKNIKRPQQNFRDRVDNSNKPFIPILRHKPNASKSLQESLQLPPGVTLEDTESPDFVYPHPYQFELYEWQPSPQQLESVGPQEPKSVDDTPVEYIDTASDLLDLCDLLKKEKEFAVDLEHHSYRTFQGFVCLMQVSTRTQDFIVDTLALRADMHRLNEVFTDPQITKVFHGADSDIAWLQRDFGVYVVNMFDTGQAARILNLARFSLAHLLQMYCQVEADKQYQLSDWRMRPLHAKMMRYAQEDTHYLLYIYDRMRNELIERGNEQKNLLIAVYSRSKDVCLKVHRKVLLTEHSHHDLYLKNMKAFNSQQLQALKDLYAWRDRVARQEDESVLYVLPNHMLMQIAEILPRERQGVLACCNPLPPLVRQGQHELHSIIMHARETTVVQTEEKKVVSEPSPAQHPHFHTSILACPHDLSKARTEPPHLDAPETGEIPQKNGSSLFRPTEAVIPRKMRPVLFALDPASSQNKKSTARKIVNKIQSALSSPFVKFLPKTDDSSQESMLKPRAFTKTWRLKENTASTGNKRKSDVDLNTFAPEFAPPAKKKNLQKKTAKPTTTTTTSTSLPQPSTSSTTTTTTTTETTNMNNATGEGEKKKKKKKKKAEEEKVVLSSRQMTKKKKKEKKKAFITDSPIPSPDPSPPTTPAPPSKGDNQKPPPPLPTPTPTPNQAKEKKKKKKKKENLTACFAAELEQTTKEEEEEEGGEERKKKKKRKKKGKVEEVVEEEVTPFDYAAADKSAVTGKMKKKIHADVYKPNFRGDRKKLKKGKKERFGAKQRKSVTFKADSGAGQKK